MLNPLPPPDLSDEIRHVPHNLEAEQALLGAIILDNRAFERVSEIVTVDDFFDPLHGRIFEVAATMIQAGRLVTPVTLKAPFESVAPVNEHMTVPQYLGRLVATATTVTGAKDYAKTIRELADRRSLIVIGEDVAAAAMEATAEGSAAAMLEEAEGRLYDLAERGAAASGGVVSFADAARRAVDQANRARKLEFAGLSTGIKDLDAKLGGLRRTDLIILAGRPSMGKTALAANIAWHVARSGMTDENGELRQSPVGFFSCEMSDEQLATRIIASEAEIPSWKITQGRTSDEEFRKVIDVTAALGTTVPLFIDQRGGVSIGQLMARARRMRRQHGIELLVVDYLQLLSGTKRERVQELTQITTGLKGLAKELSIPVIALSQLNRGVETRDDKRPQLSDLRESGSIEQDADIVMFVYRDEYYHERLKPDEADPKFAEWLEKMRKVKGKAEVIIGKQRHGPVGIVEVAFEGEFTRFSDLAREPDR